MSLHGSLIVVLFLASIVAIDGFSSLPIWWNSGTVRIQAPSKDAPSPPESFALKTKRIRSNLPYAHGTSLVTTESKRSALAEILRTQNVIPTILLNALGGLMQRKALGNLLSIGMMKANLISVFIAFASCVVNDIFDIDVDKLNSPNTPLSSGKISIQMAYLLTLIFFFLPYWISKSMSPGASFLTESSIVLLLLYTPVLKRVMVVKNLTCSLIIASTILLAAISILPDTELIFNGLNPLDMIGKWSHIFNLCTTSTKLAFMALFVCIFSRELEFDIRDVNGDKRMNICTIPVVFGVDVSKGMIQVFGWIWKLLLASAIVVWSRSPWVYL